LDKKGLGRGLAALIPGADPESSPAVSEIPVENVQFNPYQPRTSVDDEKFHELVSSVRVHGVVQPVVVRAKPDGGYELIAGERRLRAARAAGLSTVPAVVRDFSDEQSLEVALIENLQREDINAVDAARAYKRLSDEFGLSQEEIAARLGKSRSGIANTVRLLRLPIEVLEMVRSGALSEGHARAILAVEDDANRVTLAAAACGGAMSVRETEEAVKHWPLGVPEESQGGHERTAPSVSRETADSRLSDPHLEEVSLALSRALKTKVNVVTGKDRGRIEVYFYSDEDLQRLLELLIPF
jgi:ParB family transcriptional regulator, chromosome partitioning protein